MESSNQVDDTAILKKLDKQQRAVRREAQRQAEEQCLIEQGKAPRQAKLAALDRDWDEIVNNHATRSVKRRRDSGKPSPRKKAKPSQAEENSRERHVAAKPSHAQLKTHRTAVDIDTPSSSEYEESEHSNSSAASEDEEDLSDGDLTREKAKIVRAKDLFNTDDNVISAHSVSGTSRDSSAGRVRGSSTSTNSLSGTSRDLSSSSSTSEAGLHNDGGKLPSRKCSQTFSKREEVFTQEHARVVVVQDSAPANSRSSHSQRPCKKTTRSQSPLSYTSDEETSPSGKDRLANALERQWPSKIQILYDDGVKIRQQNPVIKTVIAEAIQRCEAHMLAEYAFPEMSGRPGFRHSIAKEAIKALYTTMGTTSDYGEVYRCAKKDTNFVHKIGELAVDRLSHHRNEIRTAATTHIAVYQLGVDQVCRDRVTTLFDGNIFVYDGHWASGQDKESWVIKSRTAFLNPAIIHTIKSAWFSSEQALGNQHQNLYTSSIPDRPDEKEFPISLVALAATSVSLFSLTKKRYFRIEYIMSSK